MTTRPGPIAARPEWPRGANIRTPPTSHSPLGGRGLPRHSKPDRAPWDAHSVACGDLDAPPPAHPPRKGPRTGPAPRPRPQPRKATGQVPPSSSEFRGNTPRRRRPRGPTLPCLCSTTLGRRLRRESVSCLTQRPPEPRSPSPYCGPGRPPALSPHPSAPGDGPTRPEPGAERVRGPGPARLGPDPGAASALLQAPPLEPHRSGDCKGVLRGALGGLEAASARRERRTRPKYDSNSLLSSTRREITNTKTSRRTT